MSTRWIAPGLLVAVASAQIFLAHTASLSPWLGGGFGMFATVESRGERHFSVVAESPGLIRELEIPWQLEDQEERVRAFPTRSALTALAHAIAEAESDRVPGLEAIRLQLWQTRREPGSLAPTEELEAQVRVEVVP